MTDHERLTFLQREEHRLEVLFVQAVYRDDSEVMAKVRTEYNIMFQELMALCRRLGIIDRRERKCKSTIAADAAVNTTL